MIIILSSFMDYGSGINLLKTTSSNEPLKSELGRVGTKFWAEQRDKTPSSFCTTMLINL